jgi:hypothetical protein
MKGAEQSKINNNAQWGEKYHKEDSLVVEVSHSLRELSKNSDDMYRAGGPLNYINGLLLT